MQPAMNSISIAHSEGRTGRHRILILSIAILALAGTGVSAISLQRHFARSATSFCDFNEKFNCDVVNRSEYSAVMGIPVAVIGVIGYGCLLLLSTWQGSRAQTPTRLLLLALPGLGFALYLTYIEAYVLTTWCILCLISLTLIALITVLSAILRMGAAKS
jgi:uncharacterized membrane protein